METRDRLTHLRPNRTQRWLVRAALLSGEQAVEAWKHWRTTADLGRLDIASRQLLPLLYKNLLDHGVQDRMMGRLRGVYQATWAKNQQTFHAVAPLLRAFREAGIETMILKGAALILGQYGNPGLRTMLDFDFLVPAAKARKAVALLEARGWRPRKRCTEKSFLAHHAWSFEAENGHGLDLHWRLLPEFGHGHDDSVFWKAAVKTMVHDAPTLALGPTDQLFQTCVHGLGRDSVALFRMIADAQSVLTASSDALDWDRLAAHARKHHLALRLRAALTLLKELLNSPVPEPVLRELRSVPVSKFETREYGIVTRPFGVLGALPLVWTHYRRARTRRLGGQPGVRSFPEGLVGYIQGYWGIESKRHLPLYIVFKGFERPWRYLKTKLKPEG